jgi:hypothetical protein
MKMYWLGKESGSSWLVTSSLRFSRLKSGITLKKKRWGLTLYKRKGVKHHSNTREEGSGITLIPEKRGQTRP